MTFLLTSASPHTPPPACPLSSSLPQAQSRPRVTRSRKTGSSMVLLLWPMVVPKTLRIAVGVHPDEVVVHLRVLAVGLARAARSWDRGFRSCRVRRPCRATPWGSRSSPGCSGARFLTVRSRFFSWLMLFWPTHLRHSSVRRRAIAVRGAVQHHGGHAIEVGLRRCARRTATSVTAPKHSLCSTTS